MNLDAAKRAGEIAIAIQARLDKIAEVDRCISEGWRIDEAWARSERNQACRLVLSALDPETNVMALNFIKQIYATQITALEADLATAETWAPPAPEPAPEPAP